MVLNGTIVALIAREFIEGAMFIMTHVGAIMHVTSLSFTDKMYYLRAMLAGILTGLLLGILVSLAVGYSLKVAIHDEEGVDYGVEGFEAVSKLIGAIVVSSLTLKLPRWFGMSNFQYETNKKVIDSENIESRYVMAMSLFWNILRETIEAGVICAVIIVLEEEAMEEGKESWPESIVVGAAVAVGVGGFLALGAKYVSTKGFGLIAIFISQLLAVGLWTGSAHAFEEIYAENHEDADGNHMETGIIWEKEDNAGFTLDGFGFMGLKHEWTQLQLSVFIIFHVLLIGLSVWKHYFGWRYTPAFVSDLWHAWTPSFIRDAFNSKNKQDESVDVKGLGVVVDTDVEKNATTVCVK